MWLENILAHAHLWRGITQIDNKYKYENGGLFFNDLLTKSSRTEIQTYKVEERTFGTLCIF